MLIIENQRSLDKICSQLLCEKIIAVDTEFYRRDSYYAKPSIIQLKANNNIFIIDVLASLDLTLIKEILLNNNILKLFHACREDFEIFYHLWKILPKNVCDTQIAAAVCGFGKQLSYCDLVNKICNAQIDKIYQKANWLKRPLNQDMLNYAAKDVEYLEKIYHNLNTIINENNLAELYNEKSNKLYNIANYVTTAYNAWQKIKFSNNSETLLIRVKALAAYREEQAQLLDVPRKHFLSDEDLLKICKNLPTTHKELNNLSIKSKYFTKQKHQDYVINLCVGLRYNY